MPKAKRKKRTIEPDSAFFLKMVLYLIIGSLWVKITKADAQVPFPAGLLIGLAFTVHEHFAIDRKIEYALLLVAAFIGFWAPIGLYMNL